MFLGDSYKTYHLGLRIFASWIFIGPVLLIFDAPHGRFARNGNLAEGSLLLRFWDALSIDGTRAWILMELPSPISLLFAFSRQVDFTRIAPHLPTPHTILPVLYVGHYLNRAIISPLRTPSRSNSHLAVFLSAVSFNLLNGSLMGTWLGVGAVSGDTDWSTAPMSFYGGLALFALGLWGNIWHDEVLIKIRAPKNSEPDAKPHYAIPHGGLYSLVSFPNYLCEWLEWAGFALAANSIITPLQRNLSLGQHLGVIGTPPVMFTLVEIALMLPRAVRGHAWYRKKFDDYPKDRKAAIPFML